VRSPQLRKQGNHWIAALGPKIEQGIIGVGASVESALRSFDENYLAALHQPGRGQRKSLFANES
jgi:hypothetical protein